MKKNWLPFIAITTILFLVIVFRYSGPDPKRYQSLVDPRISDLPETRMLAIEMKGDPSKTSGEAIGLLYKTYFRLKSRHKNFKALAPRARWTGNPDDRKSLTGIFGLPLPSDVASLPKDAPPGLIIAVWPYGPTAEILHRGSYTNEMPTVERLRAYIAAQGYRIVGEHEEEYLTAPSAGTSKFLTVIRYRVEKKAR